MTGTTPPPAEPDAHPLGRLLDQREQKRQIDAVIMAAIAHAYGREMAAALDDPQRMHAGHEAEPPSYEIDWSLIIDGKPRRMGATIMMIDDPGETEAAPAGGSGESAA